MNSYESPMNQSTGEQRELFVAMGRFHHGRSGALNHWNKGIELQGWQGLFMMSSFLYGIAV